MPRCDERCSQILCSELNYCSCCVRWTSGKRSRRLHGRGRRLSRRRGRCSSHRRQGSRDPLQQSLSQSKLPPSITETLHLHTECPQHPVQLPCSCLASQPGSTMYSVAEGVSCNLLETLGLIILMYQYLRKCPSSRPEPAKEEEKKFGVEDSKLPGASALPPAPLPVGAGALPPSVMSGELPCV